MFDFPDDLRTWELAEHGIGAPNATGPPAHSVSDGAFVVVDKDCKAKNSWNGRFVLKGTTFQLSDMDFKKMCVDRGGSTTQGPPDGPYPVHMWGISSQFSHSQTWVYDTETKQLSDTSKKICLTIAPGSEHPIMKTCDRSDVLQKFNFDETAQDGATVNAANGGGCLTVVPATPKDQVGVADQYMMGDDYMVAPVLYYGQRSRAVYFPLGADWVHHFSNEKYAGGSTAVVDAPLETFPLFKRIAVSTVD